MHPLRVTLRRRRAEPELQPLPASLHPVLRRIYRLRGIRAGDDLDLGLDKLPDPSGLAGCDAAAARLADAIGHGEQIVVVGDFDADGATSSAVAVTALHQLGAVDPVAHVPNRFTRGYGLTPEVVDDVVRLGPTLLVTVDNGITSLDGVDAARRHGIDVIVTDHHLPGSALPRAVAIVNPQCGSATFPGRQLAGVGVIFYLMLALRRELRRRGHFATPARSEPNLAALLDIVAVGTVADMVALDRVNRTLVHHGLQRIRAGQACAGIGALLACAGRDPRHITAGDLGFVVAPRINAAGRLSDMSIGVRCLLEPVAELARDRALELDRLNRERRSIEQSMRDQATAMVTAMRLDDDGALPAGLCLLDEQWHQGVIGIVAGRLKERLHRPVVAFAPTEESGRLRGSARSVPGIHLRDALQAIDDRHPGLIDRFGGHAMAAGLTLPAASFERFREAFADQVARQAGPETLNAVIDSDGELAPGELTLETAGAIEDGGPWGQGFPEPLFDGRFGVVGRRVVGNNHLQLRLRADPSAEPLEAIAFQAADDPEAISAESLELGYRLAVNRYRDRVRLQLVVEHLLPPANNEVQR